MRKQPKKSAPSRIAEKMEKMSLHEATARAASKFLSKDYTHVVLVCKHKKASEPILIIRGNASTDILLSARLAKFALVKIRTQIANMI